MSAPQRRLQCECGGFYANKDSLQSHKRRHCRIQRQLLNQGQPQNDEKICSTCCRTFSSYAGMRQHMRKAHPVEYNKSLQEEGSRVNRLNWTEDEENALAKAEAVYEGNDILSALSSISKRSKEAIKARRKNLIYKEKVHKYRLEQQSSKDEEQRAPLPEIDRTRAPLPEVGRTKLDVLILDSHLIKAITEIPDDKLRDSDVKFKNYLKCYAKDEVVVAFEEWYTSWISKYKILKKEMKTKRTMQPNMTQKISNRRKRAQEYKLMQNAYKSHRNNFAKKLIDDSFSISYETTPNPEDLCQHYQCIFESQSVQDKENISDQLPQKKLISFPISIEEIKVAIKNTKTNTPGPDGITLKNIKSMSLQRLLLLYNSILYLEHIPNTFRESKTILIPKAKSELHLTKNWRPITISSLILRILNKILTHRLNAIELCGNQRGFTAIDGCFANFASVETIIKHHRKHARPLSLVSLDIAKAFDTVSKESIRRAVERANIDIKMQNIIKDNYRDLTTTLYCNNNEIGNFSVNQGVKQGDPMSPFLFNAVLDELIRQLQEEYTGIAVGKEKITCLAYADDLVLFAQSPEDGQRMLEHCSAFCNKRGLKINPNKCRSLVFKTVPGKKKLYVVTEPIFDINDEKIPSVSVGEEFRYLGHKFGSEGLTTNNNDNLIAQLERIHRAPLKPQQKFFIIKTHLIPRYIAVLQRPNVSNKILKKVDRMFRAALKKILHLHSHCSNSIFYAAVKSGGLGIFQFSKMIPIITLSRWERLSVRSPLLQQTYELSGHWIHKYRKMIDENLQTKESIKEHYENELENSFSGNGIKHVKHHAACNNHIREAPACWRGEDFVRAIQLRFNLLPCKSIPSNPINERQCRAGCPRAESNSHILQKCPLTHHWRIHRHDYVVHRVATYARKKGWKVDIEPCIRGVDSIMKKPDIILERSDDIIVAEIGINWEGPTPLVAQYLNKQAKYSTEAFVEKLKMKYKGKNIFILPLIIGARGSWCHLNNALVEKLKLSNQEIADLITTTLRGSWIIHQQFMKLVWREEIFYNTTQRYGIDWKRSHF